MKTLFRLYTCCLLMQIITCACKDGAEPCEWEPWQPWSSCSTTCGVGYRARNRTLCCGPILTNCADNCHRGDNNKQKDVCNDSCPNGATVVDGICQCPPLKHGICCDIDESNTTDGYRCARHCTWSNWYSWGVCSTNCGCGTRNRERKPCCKIGLNNTQCVDDCNLKGGTNEMRQCTKACSLKEGPDGCSFCTWNNWGSWSSCSSACGKGQTSRSRSPCCCNQTLEECLKDCDLLETETTQEKPCNQLCDTPHTDLNLFLYAGGIALVSSLVTSLVWVGCCYLKMKKRKEAEEDPMPDAATGNDSVSEQGSDHYYAGVDPGSISYDNNL